ncbi:MAG: hypothetical protein ABIE94_02820 [archaeon]
MIQFKQITDLLDERRRMLLEEIHPDFIIEQKDFELEVLQHMMVDQKVLSIGELRELKSHVKEIDEWLRLI